MITDKLIAEVGRIEEANRLTMKDVDKEIQIGSVENYYGGLYVRKIGDVYCGFTYQWSILNHDGHKWEEISESLYHELLRHNDN